MIEPALHLAELKEVIRRKISHHPRGLQAEIGPSELGHPCDRYLGYKMLRQPKTNPAANKWRPTVGTAVHAWLEACFAEHPDRFITESRVHTGNIEGAYEVWGNCDLFDKANLTVIDFKCVAKTTLDAARRGKISVQYISQVHAYGVGYLRQGFPVRRVAILFLPSSGELDEAVFHVEDFDPAIAAEAHGRVSRINLAVSIQGRDVLKGLEATEHYCMGCDFFKPRSEDPRDGCPGAGTAQAKSNRTANDILMGR